MKKLVGFAVMLALTGMVFIGCEQPVEEVEPPEGAPTELPEVEPPEMDTEGTPMEDDGDEGNNNGDGDEDDDQ